MTQQAQLFSHTFKDDALLKLAFTHPSMGKKANYQRLEFLGDAVMGMLVAELLYVMYPKENEGELARRHAALVCGDTLSQLAAQLNFGEHLILSHSEASGGGRETASNLEDVFEAVIGALYLDGGLAAAKQFVEQHFADMAQAVTEPPKDAKTALQEWAQGRGLPLPNYEVIASEGPAHAPIFTIEVSIEGHPPARADASSKRAAEQLAAAMLVERL